MSKQVMVVPFRGEHLKQIATQPEQRDQFEWLSASGVREMEKGYSMTGMVDGVPKICIGAVPMWPKRYLAWALLSHDAGEHMTRITRGVRKWMNIAPPGRYEAVTGANFAAGLRWLQLLGFECVEYPAKYICPDGSHGALFVKIIEPRTEKQ